MATVLPASEFEARIDALRGRLADTDADAAVWFGATAIEYVTGFHHVQTERPVCLALTAGDIRITVPRLEVERVAPNPRVEAVHDYFDYPGGAPVETAAAMLSAMDVDSVVADADGAPGVMGYQGPPLSAFVDVADTQSWVDRMRWEKTDPELELIRESAKWGNLAHRHLHDLAEPGAHPATVSQEASTRASRAMLDALGDTFDERVRGDGPAHAGFVSAQETALPHGHTPNQRLREGDVIVTGAGANVGGYRSELERTMFVGEPTDEQRDYFEIMLEAQTVAVDALGPDVTASYVDEQVFDYFEEQGVADLARHHTGHNIGMGGHEPPYLDRGWDDTRATDADAHLAPGQVYTVEPGIYTDEAGYRHSDTVAVTADGVEWLTYYPRDLESNVVR